MVMTCRQAFVLVFLSGSFLALICNFYFTSSLWTVEDKRADLKKDDLDIAICILSSRDHFEKRQAIRETWFRDIKDLSNKKVKATFVVGTNDCLIHPADRLERLSCEKWTPINPDYADKTALYTDINYEMTDEVITGTLVNRLALKILHAVKLKRIGIANRHELPVTVTLWNGVTDDEVVSVSFSSKDPGIEHRGYRYQAIQPIILPKGFHGELATNTTSVTFEFDNYSVNNGHVVEGTILVEGMRDDRTYLHKSEKILSAVSFMFSLEDQTSLSDHLRMIEARKTEWTNYVYSVDEKLSKEEEKYGDIMFVNVTDVYRQLPKKLLLCHDWFHENVQTEFVMKTDDDCLVDIERVTNKLSTIASHKMWWGQFRDEWLVERHGKWSERVYPSSIYPRFACGSGSIVSKDIHKWIASNSHVLAEYQGEDVSLGIWLAAIGPRYHHDTSWECSKSCSLDAYVIPELTVDEMKTFWERKKKCGDPCSPCNG